MHNAGGLDGQDHHGKGDCRYFSRVGRALSIRSPGNGPAFAARNRRCATLAPKSRGVFVCPVKSGREEGAASARTRAGSLERSHPPGRIDPAPGSAPSPFSARESIDGPRDVTRLPLCVRAWVPRSHLIEWPKPKWSSIPRARIDAPGLFSSPCRRLF